MGKADYCIYSFFTTHPRGTSYSITQWPVRCSYYSTWKFGASMSRTHIVVFIVIIMLNSVRYMGCTRVKQPASNFSRLHSLRTILLSHCPGRTYTMSQELQRSMPLLHIHDLNPVLGEMLSTLGLLQTLYACFCPGSDSPSGSSKFTMATLLPLVWPCMTSYTFCHGHLISFSSMLL